MMEELGYFVSIIDDVLDNARKRHIAGGVLLSMSLLFGGLAVTIMTMNEEEQK